MGIEHSDNTRLTLLKKKYGVWVANLSISFRDALFEIGKLPTKQLNRLEEDIHEEMRRGESDLDSLVRLRLEVRKALRVSDKVTCPECGMAKTRQSALCGKCRRKAQKASAKPKQRYVEVGGRKDLLDHKGKCVQGGSPGLIQQK